MTAAVLAPRRLGKTALRFRLGRCGKRHWMRRSGTSTTVGPVHCLSWSKWRPGDHFHPKHLEGKSTLRTYFGECWPNSVFSWQKEGSGCPERLAVWLTPHCGGKKKATRQSLDQGQVSSSESVSLLLWSSPSLQLLPKKDHLEEGLLQPKAKKRFLRKLELNAWIM